MSYVNRVVAVFGHRGSGKTNWLVQHLEEYKPFVLVDPLYDPKFQELGLYHITDLEQALDTFREANPERVYISPNLQAFDFFCGLILAKGSMTLVVDEVDHYSNSYYISPYFKKLVKYGRHRQVNLVVAVRRPKEMNPLIRSQASMFVVFPMGGEDAKELGSYIPREHLLTILALKELDECTQYMEYDFKSKQGVVKTLQYIKTEKNTLDTF